MKTIMVESTESDEVEWSDYLPMSGTHTAVQSVRSVVEQSLNTAANHDGKVCMDEIVEAVGEEIYPIAPQSLSDQNGFDDLESLILSIVQQLIEQDA